MREKGNEGQRKCVDPKMGRFRRCAVLLGEKPDGVSIADGFDNMYRTKDPGKTTYNGKDYKDVYFDDGDGNRSSNFILKPNKSCICRSRRSAKTSGKLQYTRRTTETRRS
jgi:hypothetical protein